MALSNTERSKASVGIEIHSKETTSSISSFSSLRRNSLTSEPSRVRHRWSPRGVFKTIAVAFGFVIIPICFVALAYAFARSVVFPPSNMACSKLQSPPHTRNRSVSKQLCITHHDNDAAKIREHLAGENGLAFMVVGDFGRDGFCCQRDVAIEMDRVGESIQAK